MYIHLDLYSGGAIYNCSNGDIYTNTEKSNWSNLFVKLYKNTDLKILDYVEKLKFINFGNNESTIKLNLNNEVVDVEVLAKHLFNGFIEFKVVNDTYAFVVQNGYDVSIHKNNIQVGYRSYRDDRFDSSRVRIRYDHNIETDILVALDFATILLESNLYTNHSGNNLGRITFGKPKLDGYVNWFNV
jgi:hypothetical protein